MLVIEHLSKQLGVTRAIDNLSLRIEQGEIFGLLGPNGAGKTTLIRLIMGLLLPDAGSIRLFGQYAPGTTPVRQLIGYMPQALAVYPGLSVRENLLFFGHIYRLPNIELQHRIQEILAMVELSHKQDNLVSTLSGGMVRRVMLATALVHRPKLLILDEPTAGIDPLLRIRFWDWFDHMVQEGTSIIVTTHSLSEASRCGTVVFLRNGTLLEQGTPRALMDKYASPDLEAAFVAATTTHVPEHAREISQ